jgi:hypothetical protein
MKSLPTVAIRSSLLALVLCTGFACKQGEGEVCQVKADCEEGLECNAGTMRCQRPGSVVADAAPVQIDGAVDAAPPVIDAAVDASVDAAVDAGIDAAP